MKATGNGHREAGPQSLDEFTEWKTVGIDFSGKLQVAQMSGQEVAARTGEEEPSL